MRIFLWHGYLLTGTGSNEYTQALARTLQHQGHEVTVFCQDPAAADLDLGGARVIRPVLPGPLPVFVLDRYADATVARVPDLDRTTLEQFVAANVAAIRAAGPADLLITNHLLMGGPVGAGSGLPYVVKAHGSELEFAMRGNDDLCRWAGESLTDALAVIAGSQHIERVIEELVPVDPRLVSVIPPGVDTSQMRPRSRDEALAGLLAEARADAANDDNERLPDNGNADRFAELLADPQRPVIVYVGKISEEKGVPLLVRATEHLAAAVVIVGFGPLRGALRRQAGEHVFFPGPLQHRHLQYLWPLATVSVAPSVFPEAFGMVAAEAASCACPPLVADQTGLAEIAAGIRAYYPAELRHLVAFPTGDEVALRNRLEELIALPVDRHRALGAGARTAVEELWSWDSVAQRIVALADR